MAGNATEPGTRRRAAASGAHAADRLDPPWKRTSSPGRRTNGCRPSSTTSPTRGRIEVAEKIERARELGDLSENGDYHAAKDEQGHMEGRIRQLEAILENAEIIEAPEPGVVGPGTIVTIVYEGDGDDDAERYLVGHIEERTDGLDVDQPDGAARRRPARRPRRRHRRLRGADRRQLRVRVLEVEAA